MQNSAKGPLSGITVLALENYLAGNYGSQLLAMAGATVIKVERPVSGDPLRKDMPKVDGEGWTHGELRLMNGKSSIAVDLEEPAGRELLLRLAGHVDVVWTNHKPSSLVRYGFGFEQFKGRNPRIVYTTITGFGHSDLLPEGSRSDVMAFDIIAQGLAGLQFRPPGDDGEPVYSGLPLADQVTSIMAATGTLMALIARDRDDAAQRVDIAMFDVMLALNEKSMAMYDITGEIPPRGLSATNAPFNAYRSKDGWVNIAVGGDPVWQRFARAIERVDLADHPRFARGHDRVRNRVDLDEIVGSWIGRRTTSEVLERLGEHDVPAAELQDVDQLKNDQHARVRSMLIDVGAANGSREIVIPGSPIKVTGATSFEATPLHRLGQDTDQILRELLGAGDEELADIRASGAVGAA